MQNSDDLKWSASDGPAEDIYWWSMLRILCYENEGNSEVRWLDNARILKVRVYNF